LQFNKYSFSLKSKVNPIQTVEAGEYGDNKDLIREFTSPCRMKPFTSLGVIIKFNYYYYHHISYFRRRFIINLLVIFNTV
jgi:hypothetical protein